MKSRAKAQRSYILDRRPRHPGRGLCPGLQLPPVDFPHFLAHFVGGLEGVQTGRNAAIDGGVQKNFLDLFDAHPVIDWSRLNDVQAPQDRKFAAGSTDPRVAPLAWCGVVNFSHRLSLNGLQDDRLLRQYYNLIQRVGRWAGRVEGWQGGRKPV
jgi:hypothetical protein